jgi:hypothetical protein
MARKTTSGLAPAGAVLDAPAVHRRPRADAPARARPKPGPTPGSLLPWFTLALFLAALLGLGAADMFPDTWFDLAGGREIVQHGFHQTNVWTRWGSHEWVDQQWAAHVAFYGVWQLAGAAGVVLLNITLIGSGLAFCMRAALRRGGSPVWLLTVLLAVLFTNGAGFVFARSQSFSILCFGIFLWLLSRDDGRLDRAVFLVIPLIAVWTNLHAAVMLGPAICGVYALSSLMQPGPRAGSRLPRALLLVGGACLACLATPVLTGLPWYLQQTLSNPDFRHYLEEWQPTNLTVSPFFVLCAFAALVLTVVAPINRRDTLIVWILTIMGFTALRSQVWASLAWLVVLPGALEQVRPIAGGARVRRVSATLGCLVVVVLVAGLVWEARDGASRFATTWPRGATRAVAAALRENPRLKVFADQPVSDWMLFEVPALRGRLAVDGRFEVFDHRTFAEIDALRASPVRIAPRIQAEDMYILASSADLDGPLVATLERQPDITAIYRDDSLVILRRT